MALSPLRQAAARYTGAQSQRFPNPTMTDLNTAFEAAKDNAMNLSERPDNQTLLKLYGLYKQGAVGDNNEPKPGFTDFVASAKWNAWNALKGMAQDDAKQQYIDMIGALE